MRQVKKEVKKASQRALCTASTRGRYSRKFSNQSLDDKSAIFAYDVDGVTYEIYTVLKYYPAEVYRLGPIPIGSKQKPIIPDLYNALIYYNPENPSQAYLPENQKK